MSVAQDDLSALEDVAEDVALRLGLIANPKRLLILCALVEGEKSVSDIQAGLDLSQSALSQHLAKLRAGGVVTTRRAGQTIFYRIADDQIVAIMRALHMTFCCGGAGRPDGSPKAV